MNLDQIVAFALAHNPEIASIAYDGEATSARLRVARGTRLPRIGIEGGYTRYGDDLRLIGAHYNREPGVFGDNILTADVGAAPAALPRRASNV